MERYGKSAMLKTVVAAASNMKLFDEVKNWIRAQQ